MTFQQFKSYITGALLVLILLSPSISSSRDLGITPSHLLVIWTNINTALIRLARNHRSDKKWSKKFSQLEPQSYTGKSPAHVNEKVSEFRSKLIPLLEKNKVDSPDFSTAKALSPTIVFLNSGNIQNQLAHLLDKKMGAMELMSTYYENHVFSDKTPSDVFASVSLAVKRIQLLAER